MPYEPCGRSDKSGNRFEIKWVIYQMLKVIEEKIDFVILEALGDDEQGVDIWVGNKDGNCEGQQCKGRNGSKEYWNFGTANAHNIFVNWKFQLERDDTNEVALVSPLSFTLLEDLVARARNASDNPKDFYNSQILNSSKEFIAFFKNYCKVMGIDPEKEIDLIKCINYLNRTTYRQFPDSELKELILCKISCLLIGNEEDIYETFISWVVDGDILAKQINQNVLQEFLRKKRIRLKCLSTDERIVPKLEELNQEYRAVFITLKNGLAERKEFAACIAAIDLGNSVIIHGKAGIGKSGCTEAIINYCQANIIPYLAIKLDKRIPNGTAEKWGKDLGLPASIAHCIHSVSKNERAVLILDQLDALRWTQAHSRDALLVCTQIINQVKKLNFERKYKISIVFVCRTYDLENDNNIKALFKKTDKKSEEIEWKKIQVNELDDNIVKAIVGKRYKNLTGKLKEILRIPSNLYIWQQLDPSREYNECSTANHLVNEWWSQLAEKCFEAGLNESDINETKVKLVTNLEKLGKICIPKNILNANKSCLDFLSSNGFLVIQDNKVSFTHQSILDCFFAENMLKRYYDGEGIVVIIGSKEKQTPGRRYQVQMLMQNLAEIDSLNFLNAGQKMLDADEIRYYVKFIFFEVLNQLDDLDENIQNFIINNCENEKYEKYIINNVIYSHPKYIRILRENGILDKWYGDCERKNTVFRLLISMSPEFESEDVAFIGKYAFKSQEDDNKFAKCFLHDINQDTDEMFELRMKFYEKYPEMAGSYIDFKSMLKNCEMRTIRIFKFLLENKIKNHGKSIYQYEEELLNENSEILSTNSIEIINMLLPHFPAENDKSIAYSDWSGRYSYKIGIERTCVQIIKKANVAIINLNPSIFLENYKKYMGKGYTLYNEIILDAIYRLPIMYSDYIIKYLCNDFNKNLFDKTSGNGDELLLAKKVIEKYSQYCSKSIFSMLEETIISYVSPRAKELYQNRIDCNKANNGFTVYWSFWGDLQKEILAVLPYERLSNKSKELLCVLNRKFENESTMYKYSNVHSGWVNSPIAGKRLSNKKWIEILTNKKLKNNNHSHWKEVPGGFVESSIEEFSSSFNSAVSEEPVRMIKLFLSNDQYILEEYIDSLFNGIAFSKTINDIPLALLETMILRYPYNYTSQRARYICMLIEKRENTKWSQDILDIIKDIAINHKNPEITNSQDKEMHSYEMIQSNAINCVRGEAAQAIAHLLWEDYSLFEQFKNIINKLASDENTAVQLASLFALWPSYNIDKKWASEKILKVYEQDYRMAGFHGSKDMFFLLYPQYRERVLKVIKNCYESEDKDLIKMGAYSLSEMFIIKNEFADVMNNVDDMSEIQAEAALRMAIIYFNKDEYNDLSKDIICKFRTNKFNLEMPLSRLFYDNLIDLYRDKDFLIKIMESDISRRIIHAFTHYLEEKSKSVIDYKDIIIPMSYHLFEREYSKENDIWGIEDEISKLIIGLYDETSGSIKPELIDVSNECLNIWDLMFEKQIGPIRILSQKIFER